MWRRRAAIACTNGIALPSPRSRAVTNDSMPPSICWCSRSSAAPRVPNAMWAPPSLNRTFGPTGCRAHEVPLRWAGWSIPRTGDELPGSSFDRRRIEACPFEQLLVRRDFGAEAVLNADASQLAGAGLGHDLGDGASKAADHRVFLHGHDQAGSCRRG